MVKVVISRAALPPLWRQTFVRSSLVFPYPSSALIGKKKFGQRRILGLHSQQFLSISLLGGVGSVLVWDVIELLVSAPISSTLWCFRVAGCDQSLPSSFFSDPLTVCDWGCWCARIQCGALFWFEVGCLGSLVPWWSYFGRAGGIVGAVLLGGFLARPCLPRSRLGIIVRGRCRRAIVSRSFLAECGVLAVCRFFFGNARLFWLLVASACSILGTGAVFGGVGCCAVIVALSSKVIFV
ncbi:hypothetical protein ACOSQ4_004039 [Xanthoceras sorbifolium]